MIFVPGTVYLAAPGAERLYPDSVVLTEAPRGPCLVQSKLYVLTFNDATLGIFKRLLPPGLRILICVDNFEHFFYKFRAFRHLRFAFVGDAQEVPDARVRYAEVEAAIRRRLGATAKRGRGARDVLAGPRLVESIDTEREHAARGIELSFAPRIYDSIRSSLTAPARYLHSDADVSSRIYRELAAGRKSISQLRASIGGDIARELRSLVSASIVKSKDGYFYI